MKILKLANIILLSKWIFRYPEKKKILVIDGTNDPFKFIFKKNEYGVIFRRGEEINLRIIFHCLKNLKFSTINYYETYINFVKPKVILTYFDNFDFFYRLSRLTGIKTVIVTRGKRTLSDGLFKKDQVKKTNHNNFVDFMFVHNNIVKKSYEKIISGKVIPIGSLLNNVIKKYQKKNERKVLWISTYKPDGKDWINPKTKQRFKNSFFQKNDKYVLSDLYKYAKKKSIELHILGRLSNFQENEEIKFYKNIIGNNFKFISKKDFPDSYKMLEKYHFCFTTWSTLGVEKLVKGGRVGFIFNKPKNQAWNGARLGTIENFSKKGPFWTTCKSNDKKEFNRIFDFIFKSSNKKWIEVKKKYGYHLMEYDRDNKKFKKVIKSLIAN